MTLRIEPDEYESGILLDIRSAFAATWKQRERFTSSEMVARGPFPQIARKSPASVLLAVKFAEAESYCLQKPTLKAAPCFRR